MYLISTLETQLVGGGYMSASDESIDEYAGHESVVAPVYTVHVTGNIPESCTEKEFVKGIVEGTIGGAAGLWVTFAAGGPVGWTVAGLTLLGGALFGLMTKGADCAIDVAYQP